MIVIYLLLFYSILYILKLRRNYTIQEGQSVTFKYKPFVPTIENSSASVSTYIRNIFGICLNTHV